MGMKLTTLQLISRDTNGNEIQRSLAYANPTVSNYIHKHFTELLNGLTSNTYVGTVKTTKEDITDATENDGE